MVKTEYMDHSTQCPGFISQSPKGSMISQGTSLQHFSLQFLSERKDVSRTPNLSGSRPTVQRTHLELQLLEVISLATLPQAIISAPLLLKHWSVDQWQSMIKLSGAHTEMRRIRIMQWLFIQLNVFNLKDCPLLPYFCLVFNVHVLSFC